MILSIIIFILFLGFLLLLHEVGHFFVAKIFKVRVEEFGLGYPPRLWGKKIKGTIYSINWLPFGGFVKILGEDTTNEKPSADSLLAQKPWKKFLIMVAGIGLNFLAGIIFLAIGYMIGLPAVSDGGNTPVDNVHLSVLAVEEGSPAKSADLMAGDVFLEVKSDTEAIKSPIGVVEFQDFVERYKGEEILFTIEKSNKDIIDKSILVRANPPEGQGSLGIAIGEVGVVQYSFFESIWQGTKMAGRFFASTFVAIFMLIKGIFIKNNVAGSIVGPIGIAVMGGQTVQLGWGYLLQFLAGLSVSLAALNLLPIPALDGGRILFIAIEKIIRRSVSAKLENSFHGVGFILLIAVSILVAARDVIRLF